MIKVGEHVTTITGHKGTIRSVIKNKSNNETVVVINENGQTYSCPVEIIETYNGGNYD